MLHVEVYRGLEDLRAISRDWQQLFEQLERRCFFHYYGWWKSYLEALEADPGSVSFFLIRRGHQPVAIIPLKCAERRMFGLRTRQWQLPQHWHMPLSDALCARNSPMPEVLAALLRALRGQESSPWDALVFDRVLEESPVLPLLADARGRLHTSISHTCDYIVCQGSYADVTATFSRNFRSNLKKARNKLARQTGVEFTSVAGHSELLRCFGDFMDLEASGWKGVHGSNTAIKLHPALVKFYRSLIDELGQDGAIVMNCLRVGGRLIAGQFCVRYDDTLYILKLAYDEAWSHVAPGNMLLERTIQDGIGGAGFRKIDLVGNPTWFRDWCPRSQHIHTVWLFNNTLRGWVLWSMVEMKQMLKTSYRKYVRGAKHPDQTGGNLQGSYSRLASALQRGAAAVWERA
jgi:CelD/BcsL family acetyltransferase involved in cellulose biosynthesis